MVNQANEAPQGAARFNFDNLNMDQIKSQSSVWLSTFTVVGERSRGDERGKAGGGDNLNDGITIDEAATGVSAFGFANGVKGNLVEWGMKGADWGKAGAKYLKFVKRAGIVGFVVNVGISGYGSYDYYYNQNGTDWQVGAKSALDIAMGVASFVWPIGTAISGAYFILDVSSGGFGGWGIPNKP